MTAPSQRELRRAEQLLSPDPHRLAGNQHTHAEAKIRKWVPYRNTSGTMLGFFSAELPSGQIVNSLKLMVGEAGKRWVGMPDQKRRDQNDQPVLGANGKTVWDPLIEFRDRSSRDRFNALVLAPLRRDRPELFDGEP
jgi:DNA-binding cell septation regulator SpoVG